jgi:hypothetical protein
MMIMRFLVLMLASLLGLATTGAAVVAQQTQASPQAAAPLLNGDWNVSATGAKFQSGVYSLQQVNQNVIGKNAAGGQMQGAMKDPSTVEGTWRGPNGETGWFNMHLAPDGQAFSGKYGYGGRKPTGDLIGKRAAMAPAPAPSM